jgi:hypothetical protein
VLARAHTVRRSTYERLCESRGADRPTRAHTGSHGLTSPAGHGSWPLFVAAAGLGPATQERRVTPAAELTRTSRGPGRDPGSGRCRATSRLRTGRRGSQGCGESSCAQRRTHSTLRPDRTLVLARSGQARLRRSAQVMASRAAPVWVLEVAAVPAMVVATYRSRARAGALTGRTCTCAVAPGGAYVAPRSSSCQCGRCATEATSSASSITTSTVRKIRSAAGGYRRDRSVGLKESCAVLAARLDIAGDHRRARLLTGGLACGCARRARRPRWSSAQADHGRLRCL